MIINIVKYNNSNTNTQWRYFKKEKGRIDNKKTDYKYSMEIIYMVKKIWMCSQLNFPEILCTYMILEILEYCYKIIYSNYIFKNI